MNVEHVRYYHEDHSCELLAVLFTDTCKIGNVEPGFQTPPDATMQIGVLRFPEGHIVEPHRHYAHQRTIHGTPETFIVIHGSVGLTIYDPLGEFCACRFLESGDIATLLAGGHSLECQSYTVIVEVKQGPYLGKDDKGPLRGH